MYVRTAILVTAICDSATAKWLWSSSPAATSDVIQQAYPLGNGRLGLMPAGEPGSESININLDSLWAGGPFENATYSGGNPASDRSHFLPAIREEIFRNGTGNVDQLLGEIYSYGSYTPLANFTVEIDGLESYSSYFRGLDLQTGVHSVRFSNSAQRFNTSIFCSQPDDVCVYHIASESPLPAIKFGLRNNYLNSTLIDTTCIGDQLQLTGHLAQPGMQFIGISQALQSTTVKCNNGSLILPEGSGSTEVTIVFGAGSNYDQTHGNKASGFSFQGVDPTSTVQKTVSTAASISFEDILARHVQDHQNLFSSFYLDLPDTSNSSEIETAQVIARYNLTTGDPWLESLLVDYGRYMLIASSRENSLPANLQGRWAADQDPAWSADYHADINIQMNYWAAPQVGLGSLQQCLWDFIEQTWVPYGEETANLLYGAPDGSWVIHDEINTFGYTAMKNEAVWADFPLAATWMALHIPNWLDYSNDATWYRTQGYPLLKGTALFWLSQLQKDLYFNDDTLVVNPCNSPEHGPTTFGCSMYQQQIWELFDRILATWSDSGDDDHEFYQSVVQAMAHLDRGIHIGSWGQLQEWKMDIDVENDTHRHLSGLVGWYPGYSVAIEESNKTVADAVETMLWSRGDGDTDETNAGWSKVWRSACWARLNNTEEANFELRFAIEQNIAANGLSMYSGHDTPFQIDANFGLVAAVVEILIQDLPQAHGDQSIHTVVLGPAIPSSWGGGSVSGLQLRGGGRVDFSWDADGIVQKAIAIGREKALKLVNVRGAEIGS
ncbi:glycoside hydrolase family 95 protein-like protein [Penicillium verhagenii]|uniref:glycoside hydrolase family 95 protein-like protein n=1 Tax=Penicillium verhagenii TaxID=1562060 RepID=UPI0025456A28|nr:glycoside hydrolase family 95 protein-like protein [Penicillium verhagenii]KAJ5939628.1 glycoside hydrolase family 95 protein-like protein [Penicillium verhagenii]